jgi:hypothetical protein
LTVPQSFPVENRYRPIVILETRRDDSGPWLPRATFRYSAGELAPSGMVTGLDRFVRVKANLANAPAGVSMSIAAVLL